MLTTTSHIHNVNSRKRLRSMICSPTVQYIFLYGRTNKRDTGGVHTMKRSSWSVWIPPFCGLCSELGYFSRIHSRLRSCVVSCVADLDRANPRRYPPRQCPDKHNCLKHVVSARSPYNHPPTTRLYAEPPISDDFVAQDLRLAYCLVESPALGLVLPALQASASFCKAWNSARV